MQLELNSTETKDRELFKNESRGQIIGHLCLLTGLTKRKVNVRLYDRRDFTKWNREVRIRSSHRDWEIGPLSSLMILFQRDGSQVLEIVVGYKTGERLLKKVTSQRSRKRIYNYRFTK